MDGIDELLLRVAYFCVETKQSQSEYACIEKGTGKVDLYCGRPAHALVFKSFDICNEAFSRATRLKPHK